MQAKRTHVQSECQSRKEWAELCNFDVIVEREGGAHSPAAVQGAYNYCLRALSIGWCPAGGVWQDQEREDGRRMRMRMGRREDEQEEEEEQEREDG